MNHRILGCRKLHHFFFDPLLNRYTKTVLSSCFTIPRQQHHTLFISKTISEQLYLIDYEYDRVEQSKFELPI
jgi:hypothetical protein